jgi:hypothetical protein
VLRVFVRRYTDMGISLCRNHRTSDKKSDEWRQVEDDSAKPTKPFAAYTAATRNVEWMMD